MRQTLESKQDDNWTEFCPDVVGECVIESDDAYYAVWQVLLWDGLSLVEDGKKDGGGVSMVVNSVQERGWGRVGNVEVK
jgi:hypothetical protein